MQQQKNFYTLQMAVEPGFSLHKIFCRKILALLIMCWRVFPLHLRCQIDWKKGKNVTLKTIKKKQKHKGRGTVRTVTKTVSNDSFFNFFAPPEGMVFTFKYHVVVLMLIPLKTTFNFYINFNIFSIFQFLRVEIW